ncbi:SixA phosphatase family protein [Microlunatus flavus]|uniref:Phosphohistidine phosphatase n=1 Tax=Microlunatus flavus TaxID=1036181 RepID=A0A1H9CK52_9ACTN|nr:histidine phosphatase family protein [Microlunatus flavus]SEQ01606.1 phosphohistidine phosphatase [Microlunatus flavus]
MTTDGGGAGTTARRLVLLRHAKSSWAEAGLADADRPLNDRGRRDAAAAGRWLAAEVGRPDLVLCSTALRTRQTWSGATSAAPLLADVPVRYEAAVYEAWSDTLLDLVRALAPDVRTAVLVGHSPGVPDLAERLNRATGTGPVGEFPTSAVAVLAVDGPWTGLGPGSASLLAYAVPRG